MEEVIKKEKKPNRIKLYGVIVGLILLVFQYSWYRLCNVISTACGFTPFLPKIDSIDDAIPVVAVFIVPYVWSYAYWAICPMVASRCEFKHFLNMALCFVFSCFAGGAILIFAPSYMDRAAEGLINRPQNNIFEKLLHFIYMNDGGDMAFNLFPSLHCLFSVVCALMTFRRKEVALWYRIYSPLMTVVICLSTLFTKQHYILDMLVGVPLGIVCYILFILVDPAKYILKWHEKRKAKKLKNANS